MQVSFEDSVLMPKCQDLDALVDPSGDERAAREAAYEHARQTMGPPRTFRMCPDGVLHEVGLDEL